MSDRQEQLKRNFIRQNNYNMPIDCSKCGGLMVYKGIGEYQCNACGFLDYDDFGKVHRYIEKNRNATLLEVAEQTGVRQENIREMLRDSRLELRGAGRRFF